ncbi:hypothetical protein Cni_G18899 [Canna indica]|uniref:RING-type domain-containing protein n=1 Tax=Canna indica TaxID=4628 RepID=A0AAQ3KLJ6_9LILI|nr:hypothetical protein Cni_G18899 [Canna indica]
MADFRQKHETANRDFRRGLEELVRGHIDGCMSAALSSCSSSAAAGEDEEDPAAGASDGADQLVRRRRRSNVAGEDLAETSAAARRHSRILSRWVARHAEEMMTTMERRNRESELMALARLHTVSTLDASFLGESRRLQATVERPRPGSARASSILQRWRELEDASAAARERERLRAPSPTSNSQNRQNGEESRNLAEWVEGSELASSESDGNDYRRQGNEPTEAASIVQNAEAEETDDRESSREQSPDLGGSWEGEREGVRQIVRGWMMSTAMAADTTLRSSSRSESQSNDWLGEIERERVRLARERVRLVSQQRHAQANRIEEPHGRARLASDHQDPPDQFRRDQPRLRGRQARLDLIMRMVRERERELQSLSEHRSVSSFAYRNRIQSFLRGRFLRNFRPSEDERPSMAARELGQIRHYHPVSGLREGMHSQQPNNITGQANNQFNTFDSRNDNSINGTSSSEVDASNSHLNQYQTGNENTEIFEETTTLVTVEMENRSENAEWTDNATQGENWPENAEHGEEDWQQSTDDRFSDGTEDEYGGNWQESIDHTQLHETPEGDAENNDQEVHEYWEEDGPQDTEPVWQDESLDSLQHQQSLSFRRVDRFMLPDDDNVYSLELRELLRRRSVSNLLSSGFRESLDQLIESYVRRQERNPFDWDLQGISASDSQEIDQDQQRDDLIQNQQISTNETPAMLQSPPVPPPPPPLWHSNLHHTNWARQRVHHSEWDVINDLKAELARIQEGMSHMQRIMETCMDMQLELQRAVRQEVSAALNRYAGEQGEEEECSQDISKWVQVKKGTCCICCDSHIDSLLYRCGHMCTCSKCANELVRAEGRCPLCRAPILEVIRAYSVL